MADKPPLHESANTSSWVDELYSKRLASQDLAYIRRDPSEGSPLHRLSTLRSSRLYLREEIVRGPGVVAITQHALERLHERLRTNALGDVYRLALRPLSRVPRPVKAEYMRENLVLHLQGLGVFPVKAIGAIAWPGVGVACWGVLTYVPREPRADECVICSIGPER
jgi:hypothetical protein